MGYFMVFRCNRFLIQQEMKSRIRSGQFQNNMILIKIVHPQQEKNFRRVDKNEFTWSGNLYDIIAERRSGDTTCFYCLHDKREENLIHHFAFFLKRTGHDPSSRKESLVNLMLQHIVTIAMVNPAFRLVPASCSCIKFPDPVSLLLPANLVRIAPPPKTT